MYEERMFAGHDPARCPSCWRDTDYDRQVYRHVCPLDGPLEVAWIPIDGGVRLPDLETPTHFIDISNLSGRWRICATPKRWPGAIDASWLYAGGAPQNAITAAYAWHQSDRCAPGTRPAGFVRDMSGRSW